MVTDLQFGVLQGRLTMSAHKHEPCTGYAPWVLVSWLGPPQYINHECWVKSLSLQNMCTINVILWIWATHTRSTMSIGYCCVSCTVNSQWMQVINISLPQYRHCESWINCVSLSQYIYHQCWVTEAHLQRKNIMSARLQALALSISCSMSAGL